MKRRFLPLICMVLTSWAGAGAMGGVAQESAPAKNANANQEISAPPKESKPKIFEFGGGMLQDFIAQVKNNYGVDLWELADIPQRMRLVRVPKIRTQDTKVLGLLNLYNQISAEIPSMGHWVMKGSPEAGGPPATAGLPSTIILIPPDQQRDQSLRNLSIRAFSLRGINAQDRESLMHTIRDEGRRWAEEWGRGYLASDGVEPVRGEINYHAESNVLVASGSDAYISLVESLVDAFRDRARPELKLSAPSEKQTPSSPTPELNGKDGQQTK